MVPNFRSRLCDRRYLGVPCWEWQHSLGRLEQFSCHLAAYCCGDSDVIPRVRRFW